jgi:uncharacterized membrane protein
MGQRLVFIDLLRGWATLVMIEVHVVNAMLLSEFRGASWFSALNFINGLVAPSFLFVAGFVFVIASERKIADARRYRSVFWKQIARILLILSVGYLLHLPFFSFQRIVTETTSKGWLVFFQADILHCIAVGLLILFALRLWIREDKPFVVSMLIGGWVFVLAAPFLWEIDFIPLVTPVVAAYMNGIHYSQFPVFPWLAFMLFGGITAVSYITAEQGGRVFSWVRSVLWLGVGCMVVGALAPLLPVHIPFVSEDIRANPFFFLLRFGIVLLLMVACYAFAESRGTKRSFVLTVSKESLLVYAAHLMVIYGDFWSGRSLARIFGKTFSIAEAFAAALALMLLMIALAYAWDRLKRRSRALSRVVTYATVGIGAVIFFIRE